MNLSIKGHICSKINYKENFILIELIYRGIFVNLSFSLTITLLLGLVWEDYQIYIPLNPNLFTIHDKFQTVVFELYSIFKDSSLSLYLLRIIKRKSQIIFNIGWAWCNNFLDKKNPLFSNIDKNMLNNYLEYVLKIIDLMAKVYQSLGNIFLATKFEGFWFCLQSRLAQMAW